MHPAGCVDDDNTGLALTDFTDGAVDDRMDHSLTEELIWIAARRVRRISGPFSKPVSADNTPTRLTNSLETHNGRMACSRAH
jgi:hypothetical protein